MTIKERLEAAQVQAIQEHLLPILREADASANGISSATICKALIGLCLRIADPVVVEGIFREVLASQETE